MMKEIFLILACVPLYVINSFCDKIISSREQNRYNYFYNALKFLICGICMLPMLIFEKKPVLALGSLLCGIFCGIMYAISKTVMLRGYEKTSVAFMTLCHSSGMILPCIIGHFFWGERLSIMAALGVLLAILSIVLLKGGDENNKKLGLRSFILGAAVFLASAGVMIAQKLMGLYFAEQSISAYNFYSFIVPFLIIGCLVRPKQLEGGEKKNRRLACICALGSAVSLSVISFVMTSLSGSVPSVLLFPLFNGLGITLVCIGSAFAFKERLTGKKLVGLLLGVIGLCLINL
ncbi:MAG: EamA family transporter [Clostridia bacterium]|nr:EamA family transporter [Clostridia bacterium]